MDTKKIMLALLVAGGLGIGGYWYVTQQVPVADTIQKTSEPIVKLYVPEKHKQFIQKQFKENWYWLISSPDYDINYALDTHSPNHYEPLYKGKMTIVVLEVAGEPVGFGTYYMRNAFQGDILFIEVAKEHRGKRYAGRLVKHAEVELKKMGAKIVKLATRVENEGARKLYNRLEYPEVGVSNGFVHYRKEV